MNSMMKRLTVMLFASLVVLAGTWSAMGALYIWTGADTSGNMSVGNNWGGTAPGSSTANDWTFASNTQGLPATNDIANPCSVHSMTNGVSMTFAGSPVSIGGATPFVGIAPGITVTYNNDLVIGTGTKLSSTVNGANTSTVTFNGQLSGATLTYANNIVNSTTPILTFKFASATANTINGFTLGDLTANRGKAIIQVAMNDPFGGVPGTPTTLTFANSGDITMQGITSARTISSAISLRNNLFFSGRGLTFRGGFAVSSTGTSRTLGNGLDSGETLSFATDPAANFNSANGAGNLSLTGSVSAVTVVGPGFMSNAWMLNPPNMNSYLGTLRLTGANTFAQGITNVGYTLEFSTVQNGGSATANALGKPSATEYTIRLGSATKAATLKYIGTAAGGQSTDRSVDLAGTTWGASIDASGGVGSPISFTGNIIANGAGSKTLTLTGANTDTNTIAGAIADNGGGNTTALLKDGTGTWVLTGTSTYTGSTTVKGGKLLVNGSLAAGSAVTVTNATLGGTGTINGSLTVTNSGIVAPGASIGTLTNNLSGGKTATYASGATFAFDLGVPGTSDTNAFSGLVANTTNIFFNNNTINFSNAGGLAAGTYTLFTFDAANAYSGTVTNGTGLEGFNVTFSHNSTDIQLTLASAVQQSTVTIAQTADGAEEGPANGLFTVSRPDDASTGASVTVYYTLDPSSTALPGSDFTPLSSNVVLGVGVTNATIAIPVLQDLDFNEGSETVTLNLSSNAAYAVGNPSNATVNIADGLKSVVTIVKTADGAEDGPVNGSFAVRRPTGLATGQSITVYYTLDPASTAISGNDFATLSSNVVLGVGVTNATITVPVLYDVDFGEGTETVTLGVSSNAAYVVGNPSNATVNITDAIQPVVTITKTADGSEEGPVNGSFSVNRQLAATGSSVTVYYTLDPSSTATPGSDFTALSSNVVLGVGITSAPIAVAVLRDYNFAEGAETVILNLSSNAAYTVGNPSNATVNIADGIAPAGYSNFTALYTFSNTVFGTTTDPTPVPYDKAIIFGAFSLSSGIGANNVPGSMFADGWPANAGLNTANYMGVTVTPTNGALMTITNITFDVARQTGGGPVDWAVRSSLDNYAANLQTFTSTNGNLSIVNNDTVVIGAGAGSYVFQVGANLALGPNFANLSTGVTFRVYGWVNSGVKDGGIDNFNIQGHWAIDGIIAVTNEADVTATEATLRGYLKDTNGVPTEVWVAWGESDGGMQWGAWGNTNALGQQGVGLVTNRVAVEDSKEYYYRFVASNSVKGEVWSALYTTFATLSSVLPTITIAKTTDGTEEGPVPATFTVSRPGGQYTNVSLAVTYTVDGTSTATSGSDYTALSGSVTLSVGETNATITVPVLQDADFNEGTEWVKLDLVPDVTYTVGDPSNATANISDGIKPVITIVKAADGTEEGPANGSFRVMRPGGQEAVNYSLVVSYTVDGASTATSGSDYTALSGSVTMGVGATNATITVPVLKDTNFAEGTETVIVNLSAAAGYTVGAPGSASLDIADATEPVVTIAKTSDASEFGAANGSFMVSRQLAATGSAVTVYYTTSGSATSGSDFSALSSNVTIAIGQTTAVISLSVLRDGDYNEGVETAALSLLTNAWYLVGNPSNATANIADDIAPDAGTTADFSALYTFSNTVAGTVTDPTPSPYDKGVVFGAFSMAGGAAIGVNGSAGAFYANDWDASAALNPGAYFRVTLTPAAGARMTITNITFDVNRQASVGPTNWAVRSSLDGYAANLSTFTSTNPQLSVLNGNTLVITTPAPTAGSWQSGGRLALDSSFSNLTNSVTFRVYGWGAGADKDGGIDNFNVSGTWVTWPQSTVSIVKTADGAEEGPANGSFEVSRPADDGTNMSLSVFYTVAGSATPSSDYSPLSGFVAMGAGVTSATVVVPVLQDADFNEGPETVIANLSSNYAYAIGSASNATVTIADGIKPVVTIVKTADGAEEGPVSGSFIVSRTATGEATNFALTVHYAVDASSTATAGIDYTTLSGSVILGAGATSAPIAVAVLADADYAEGTETIVLNLSPDPAYAVGNPGKATLNITDGIVKTTTWNGGNASGAWSIDGVGGNWSDFAAPTSSPNNDLTFAVNISGQTSSNDIADPLELNTMTFSNDLAMAGGAFLFSGTNRSVTVAAGRTVTFNNNLWISNSETYFQGAGDGIVNGIVQNASAGNGFTKDGAGTWALENANTYTGPTRVKAGKLLVNGSINSAVTVSNSATLGGTGTLNGALAVAGGGTVTPGVIGVGTLTNNLSGGRTAAFASGAGFTFDIGAPGTSDALAFTGLTGAQVSFNGNVINFNNVGGLTTGLYTLFTFDAPGAYSGTPVVGSGLSGYDGTLILGATSIQMNVSVLPSVVRIMKTTDGSEEGPVNGSFTVSRPNTFATGTAVTVYYTVDAASTATAGSDYTALSSNVVLGMGVTSATVVVSVLRDYNFTEGAETVKLNLSADPAYTVGTPASATATITDAAPPDAGTTGSFTALYTFSNAVLGTVVDPTTPPYEKTIQFGAFSMAGIIAPNGLAGAFYAQNWRNGTMGEPSSAALLPNQYFTVTVAPLSGARMSITNITFAVARQTSGGYGPTNWAVRSSLDNYAANLSTFTISPATNTLSVLNNDTVAIGTGAAQAAFQSGANLTLDSSFSDLTQSVTFRVYGWCHSDAKDGGIDNFTFRGLWQTRPLTTVFMLR